MPDLSISSDVFRDVFSTAVLVLLLAVVRYFAKRYIGKKTGMTAAFRRQSIANLRIALALVLVFGLVLIWAPQLRTFALSLTAVAAALVLATKELILCLSGSFVKSSTDSFAIGSWVKVGDVTGEVIDQRLLTTKIQEVSPDDYHYTGRTVVLPNSVFLTVPVYNLHFLRQYVFHSFSVFIPAGENPEDSVKKLRAATEAVLAPLLAAAEKFMATVRRKADADVGSTAPQFRALSRDEKKTEIVVTIFCPRAQALSLEQDILRRFWA